MTVLLSIARGHDGIVWTFRPLDPQAERVLRDIAPSNWWSGGAVVAQPNMAKILAGHLRLARERLTDLGALGRGAEASDGRTEERSRMGG